MLMERKGKQVKGGKWRRRESDERESIKSSKGWVWTKCEVCQNWESSVDVNGWEESTLHRISTVQQHRALQTGPSCGRPPTGKTALISNRDLIAIVQPRRCR